MGRYNYKLIVVGSGAAGKTAALLAAKAKIKTAIIENEDWGGSTLNTRDVPYNASLHFSHLYNEALDGARFGLSSKNLRFNYPTVTNWRNLAIKRAGGNSKKEFEEAGIACFHGLAHFLGAHEISVGDQRITGEKFVIATGSVLAENGITGTENVECYTPDTILKITRIPKAVFVVGAGSSGLEIAQYFANLGVQVILADLAEKILPNEDIEVSQLMEQYLTEKSHIKVLTKTRVVSVEEDEKSKKVIFIRGGQEKSVRVDTIVLATGVKPAIDLGLENAGVKTSKFGIKVNNSLQTSSKHIWAAGDVIGGHSSTEKAVYEATLVASNIIKNGKATVNYNGMMHITNIIPQVARVGLNEQECKAMKKRVKVSLVSLSDASVSNTKDFRAGFIKMLADRKGVILGATAVMPNAALVLQEVAMAVRYGLSVRELAGTPHAANEWSDVVRLAAKKLANK